MDERFPYYNWERNPSDPGFYDDYDSGAFLPDEAESYADIPTEDERPSMQAWEEQNADKLAKMSKRKQAIARYDALKEIRVQRAREQIETASPDEASEPGTGSGSPT